MTLQGVPTVFPNGVTNAAIDSFGARVPMPWPPQYYTWFSDFDEFRVDAATTPVAYGDWLLTVVEAGAGDTTYAVSDAFGGVLLITTAANEDDGLVAQWQGGNAASVAETFVFTPGKELWFGARFQLSEVTQSDFVVGLVIADTDPLTAFTDGVAFTKPDGSAVLSLTSNIVTPLSATDTLATLVADTWYEFAFHYNGVDAINAYQDGQFVGSVGITALPTTELAVTFGYRNGAAGAETCMIDWIFASAER